MTREEAILLKAIEKLSLDNAAHGEWHKTENEEMEITGYYCSVCDMPTDEPTNYCPNCGADMRGGENE
jgi:rubrerythrin